jgi:hypothetical protein
MAHNESIGVVIVLKNCAYATLKKNKIIKFKTLKNGKQHTRTHQTIECIRVLINEHDLLLFKH